METLTIEYLPAFKQYRVWNSNYEEWFTQKIKMIKVLKKCETRYNFKYVTYGSQHLIEYFKKHNIQLVYVGKGK